MYLPDQALFAGAFLLACTGVLGLLGFVLRKRLGVRGLSAFLLLIMLLSVFGVLILVQPKGIWPGLAGFGALVGSFWLLSRFEGTEPPS